MRQFNLANLRAVFIVVAGLLVLTALFWGGWQYFRERTEEEREPGAEVPCEKVYTDLKEAFVDDGQGKGPVCGIDISGKKYLELTRGLAGLEGLVTLDASDNIIREIPDWIGEMDQLQRLDLSHNQISALPLSLGQLKNLKALDLTGNPIPQDRLEAAKETLPNTEIKY